MEGLGTILRKYLLQTHLNVLMVNLGCGGGWKERTLILVFIKLGEL